MSDRPRLRRRLLILGILPALVVTGLAAKTAHLFHYSHAGASALNAGDADAARRAYASTGLLNIIEPWAARYNEGIAAYFQGGVDGNTSAVDLFRAALDLAPPQDQCRVRRNLAIAIEAKGDTALQVDLAEAREQWYEARATLGACLPDAADSTAPDTEARGAMTASEAEAVTEIDRGLADKLVELELSLEADPDRPFQGKDANFDDLTPREQEEILELRNQEGRRVREKERDRGPSQPFFPGLADPDRTKQPPAGSIYYW